MSLSSEDPRETLTRWRFEAIKEAREIEKEIEVSPKAEGWLDEASRKAEASLNANGIKIPWHFGDRFGDRFKVVGLRAGGIGVVFFVEDTQFKGRLYAAKTLQSFLKPDYLNLPGWQQERISKAFLEEALPWLEMGQHPNIVSVHLLENIIHPETKRNIPFVFSEFIEKGTLLKLIKDKPSLEEIFNVSLQVCEGLIHAYKYISAHKDLKPENIMIYDEGIYKITDFSAGIIGTPIYMAPEQLIVYYKMRGLKLTSYELPIDHRADQFAIGLIIVDMLKGGNKERIDYITSNPKRFVEEGLKGFLVGIPDCLEEILNCCLKPRPEDRFRDINSLKEALLDAYKKEFKKEYKFPKVEIDDSPDWWFNRGRAFYNIGRYVAAIEPFNKALSILKSIPGTEIEQAICLMDLAIVYDRTDKFDKAEKLYKEALSIYKSIPGKEIDQARCLMNLGVVYDKTGKFDRAEELYNEALGIYKSILGTEIEQASCLANLAGVYERTGKFDRAKELYKEALSIYKSFPGTEIKQATCLMNLAIVYRRTGKFNKAKLLYSEALGIYKSVPGTEIEQANCFTGLGLVYQSTGKFDKAEELYKEALSIHKSILGTEIGQAICLMNLANVYCSTSKFDRAEDLYREALSIYKSILGTEIEQARCLMNLGILYVKIKEFKKARDTAEEALKICEGYPLGTEEIKEVCLKILNLFK